MTPRTLILATLVLAAVALPLAPTAAAHHIGCEPDYPCTPTVCDAKCWITHFTRAARCLVDPAYC